VTASASARRCCGRVLLEIDDDNVVLRKQDLPEMIVAVQARLRPRGAVPCVRAIRASRRSRCASSRSISSCVRLPATNSRRRAQGLEGSDCFLADAFPSTLRHRRRPRVRVRTRRRASSCERSVQLASAPAQGARQRDVATVNVRAGRGCCSRRRVVVKTARGSSRCSPKGSLILHIALNPARPSQHARLLTCIRRFLQPEQQFANCATSVR
jgi:hypothetical protein